MTSHVSSLSPTTGVHAGDTVTVTGTGFTTSAPATNVTANGVAQNTYIDSPTQLHFFAPTGSGTATVATFDGTPSSPGTGSATYTYAVAAPTVSSIFPTSGSTTGGYPVSVYGTNFSGMTQLLLGGVSIGFTYINSGQCQFTAPAHNAGTLHVQVVTPGGTSATSSADQFTYNAPAITSISPTSGTTVGGTSVVIHGGGFSPATAVLIDGISSTAVINSDTQITVTTPAHAAATVHIQVFTPYGNTALTAADQFIYDPALDPPTIAVLSPNKGTSLGGTNVVVSGSHFTGASNVMVDGVNVNIAYWGVSNDNTILLSMPAHAIGVVYVQVTTPYGTSPASGTGPQYTYVNVATITGISPNYGGTGGNTPITITGQYFTGATQLEIGDGIIINPSQWTLVSDTEIMAVTPAHAAGAVSVYVTTPNGRSTPVAPFATFTYVAPPTVSSITPTHGSMGGGNFVSISGTNFGSDATKVQVWFGEMRATGLVVNPTQILCVAPSHMPGIVDVIVVVGSFSSPTSSADQYTYDAPSGRGGPVATTIPCNKSLIYDRAELIGTVTPGAVSAFPSQLLSLCDRVPAGKYVIIRHPDGNGPLSNYASQIKSWGLRGALIQLSDDGQTVPSFNPSGAVGSADWQFFQYQLQQDQLGHTPPVAGELPGPQSFRAQHLPVGGFFVLRGAAYASPAGAGAACAQIRNQLNLDFVMIDVDDPVWNTPGAGIRLLVILQHMQQQFVRSPQSPAFRTLSQHHPVFVVFNGAASAFPNLLATDNTVEGLVNGYSGPKSIAAPRIPANGGQGWVQAAWQWARPIDDTGRAMNHVEPVLDMIHYTLDANTVGWAASDELAVSYPGMSTNWTVNSGAVFLDDYHACLTQGTAGTAPTQYWDYDTDTHPTNAVPGALIPSYYPDPMPLAQVDHDWAWIDPTDSSNTHQHFNISFENWRTGHLQQNNYPTWVRIDDAACGDRDTMPVLRNWVQLNGSPITTTGYAPSWEHALVGRSLDFSGVPVAGDDGIYPFFIEVRRSQSDHDLATKFAFVLQVTDPARVQHGGSSGIGSTGMPTAYPDIAASTRYGSGLHSPYPRAQSGGRIPFDWTTLADWCKGVKGLSATHGLLPPLPLPPRVVGTPYRQAHACGYDYLPDVVDALADGCGPGLDGVFAQAYCDTLQKSAQYVGFGFATAAALSGMDAGYSNGNLKGLFALDQTFGAGAGMTFHDTAHPESDLGSVAINIDKARAELQQAWALTTTADCVNAPYEQQVRHAYLLFTSNVGNYPGSAPAFACGQTPINGSAGPPNLSTMAATASCFSGGYNQVYVAPGVPTPTPSPTTPNAGSPDIIDICTALKMAYTAGWRNGTRTYGGGGRGALDTLVMIALHEATGPTSTTINTKSEDGTSATGLLQFQRSVHSDISRSDALDPIWSFNRAHGPGFTNCDMTTGFDNCSFDDWTTYTSALPGGGHAGTYGGCDFPNSYCYSKADIAAAYAAGCDPSTGYTAPSGTPPYTGTPGNADAGGASILGCPTAYTSTVASGICITAECEWHWQHEGLFALDIAGPKGTPLLSPCDGVVYSKRWTYPDPELHTTCLHCGYGIEIVVQCDHNIITNDMTTPLYVRYGHNDYPALLPRCTGPNAVAGQDCTTLPEVGTKVHAGEQIGIMGYTGHTESSDGVPEHGTHVHYEINSGGLGPQYTVCPISQATSAPGSRGAAGQNYIGPCAADCSGGI